MMSEIDFFLIPTYLCLLSSDLFLSSVLCDIAVPATRPLRLVFDSLLATLPELADPY